MSKIIKWFLIVSVIVGLLYLAINFLVVSWISYFSNPRRIEKSPKEIILFERLKKEYGFYSIERSPETERELLEPKDTLTYTLYISKINCNNDPKEIELKYQNIDNEINQLKLNSNFYQYEIVFYCKKYPPTSFKFRFLRKKLN